MFNYLCAFDVTALSAMTSGALDDFTDDCFVEKDLICNLYIEDALWLDQFASDLIAGALEKDK